MPGRIRFLLFLLVLGLVLPFLNKPVHIDDTFVLEITERILENPLDPFAGENDWFGHLMPVWRATTNPPLISYWLAPVAAIFGYSEIWLHLAIVPFYLLLAWGVFSLAERFSPNPALASLFVLCSAPVLVSGNLMRDIPAAALAVAGTALLVRGTDRSHSGACLTGSLLLGASVLAKYSVGVILPVAALYPLLRGRPRKVFWLTVAAIPIGLWCALTWVQYGSIHPLYLLLERSSEAGIPWQDKLFGGISILGTSLLLQVPLLLGCIRRGNRLTGAFLLAGILAATLPAWYFYGPPLDWGFEFWTAMGAVLLIGAIAAALREGIDSDLLFLAAWFLSHVLFSVFLVPFQAVRHLIVALVPLVFLLFRGFTQLQWNPLQRKGFIALLLVVQGVLAVVVHVADFEYADAYRDFASRYVSKHPGEKPWYVGHWGWKFYAEQAGFRMMHRDGPYPSEGDLLIWPEKVHIGDAFGANPELRNRLELLESTIYPGTIPIRVMSTDVKAGFYAVVRRRIPLRFNGESPLEVFRVYRVGSQRSVRSD